MALITPKAIQGNNNDISKVFSFHDSQNPYVYYQESNVSFALTIFACHPENHEESVISLFTPEMQFNYVPPLSLRDRVRNSMHQHNHFEFMYILNGNMYQIVEGKRFLYTPGSCCLLNRNTLHTEEYTTDYQCIFFSVSTDFVSRLTNYGNSLLFAQERAPSDNLIFRFLEQNMDTVHDNTRDFLDFIPRITENQQKAMVHNIFEQMLSTLLSPYYGATYRLLDLFCQLIDILSSPQYYNVEHVTTTSGMESLLFARIDQLLAAHRGRISNAELSRLLNYNGSYLGRIVKNFTGKSLFDYSMTFTMAAAADLLVHTKKSVSRIAEELHFTNRTHFYRLFQKCYGVTPKEYREKMSGTD